MSDRPDAGSGAQTTVVVCGVAAVSAFGRGTSALLDALCAGRSAFQPVTRFDVSGLRAQHAAVPAWAPGEQDRASAALVCSPLRQPDEGDRRVDR